MRPKMKSLPETSETRETRKYVPRKRKNVCCICGKKNELIEGQLVKFHSFPTNFKLRETWIRRLKSVKADYVWMKNHRLCSVHFIGGVYDKVNPVPSIFIVNDMERVFKNNRPSQTQKDTQPDPPSTVLELGENLRDWHAAATVFGKPMSEFVCHLLCVHAKHCLHCAALSRITTQSMAPVVDNGDGCVVDHIYSIPSTEDGLESTDECGLAASTVQPPTGEAIHAIHPTTGETIHVKQEPDDRSLMAGFNNNEAQRELIDCGRVEVFLIKKLNSDIISSRESVKTPFTASSHEMKDRKPDTLMSQAYYEQPLPKTNRQVKDKKLPKPCVNRIHSDNPRSLLKVFTQEEDKKLPTPFENHIHSDNPRSLLKSFTVLPDYAIPQSSGDLTSCYSPSSPNIPEDVDDDDDIVDDFPVQTDDIESVMEPLTNYLPLSRVVVEPPHACIPITVNNTTVCNDTNLIHLPQVVSETPRTPITVNNNIHIPEAVDADTPHMNVTMNNVTVESNDNLNHLVGSNMASQLDETAIAIKGLLQSPEYTVVADLGPAVTTTCATASVPSRSRSKKTKSYRYEKVPVSCPQCNKTLASLQSLTSHMKLHNKDPRFTCQLCGKATQCKRDFQYHMGRHTNSNHYECTVCGKVLQTLGSLRCHMKSHSGVKDIPCTLCNELFMVKGKLKYHMHKVHGIGKRTIKKNTKLFICEYCPMMFKSRGGLLAHHNIHDEIPKVKVCDHCGKRFANDASLVHHISNIHKERPKRIRRKARIMCHLCGRTLWDENLRKHNLRRHKDKIQNMV